MKTQRDRTAARAVIFDLGKVLVDFDHTRTYRAIARSLNRDFRTVQDVLESSDLQRRYEIGAVETSAFRHELRSILGCAERDLPDELLDESWGDMFEMKPEMVELLKELRTREIPLLLLSNTDALHFDHIRNAYPEVVAPFDETVLSYCDRGGWPGNDLRCK